jgi:hypothetical protein
LFGVLDVAAAGEGVSSNADGWPERGAAGDETAADFPFLAIPVNYPNIFRVAIESPH